MGNLIYNYLIDYRRMNLMGHKTGKVQPRKLHKETAGIEPGTSLQRRQNFRPQKPIFTDSS